MNVLLGIPKYVSPNKGCTKILPARPISVTPRNFGKLQKMCLAIQGLKKYLLVSKFWSEEYMELRGVIVRFQMVRWAL